MGETKAKLKAGRPAFGGWVMIGHPTVADLLAGEAFDWIAIDMEHSATELSAFENICRAVEGSGKDVLVRLHSCDEVLAKRVLDIGANGIIVPNVCTKEEAEKAVRIAKYPPEGIRGASLARCTDHGRNFAEYFAAHNESVIVAVMLEHAKAVANVEEILAVPGIDAIFIGPYDLSSSMNLAGQLDHPDVLAAQQRIVDACAKAGVPSGIHVVPMDRGEVERRVKQGFRFIALGLDTEFIIQGARAMLG